MADPQAYKYDLMRDFSTTVGGPPGDPRRTESQPGWIVAVFRLGRPLSYSRKTTKSIGGIVDGAFLRKESPLLIIDDIHQITVENDKRSHTKTMTLALKSEKGGPNYLSQDVVLPGDWVMGWMFNNTEDVTRIAGLIQNFSPCNGFNDGLKFVGRAHSVRKNVRTQPDGTKESGYSLQAIGFEELDTQFFYDLALASAASVSSEIRTFMAQIGLEFSNWANQAQMQAGNVKDNADRLIVTLIDIILGKGISEKANQALDRAQAGTNGTLTVAPQANKEAPFAYLVPRAVGLVLGRQPSDGSKGNGLFGYADILDTLIGTQQYSSNFTPEQQFSPFYPAIDTGRSTASRKYTPQSLKGTFLPVSPSFVNRPLWSLLQQYLNPAINECYTALRVNESGTVAPTLVARQIPFSTEAMAENPDFPVTRFLSLPRWLLSAAQVTEFDVGRSNATRCNGVHVYGEASVYAANKPITNQLVRNPPIYDAVDIARSGMHMQMQTVNCALSDQVRKDGARLWMEAMADWSFGSQFTLNGVAQCDGIQAPIAEGDNVELEGVVYHIEGVTHTGQIQADGNKSFTTSLRLSNGMPADQHNATGDFPVYPGITNTLDTTEDAAGISTESTGTTGDNQFGTSLDPEGGVTTRFRRFQEE